MATIVIKDLSENIDLDRQAMRSISGGSRLASQMRSQLRSRGQSYGAAPARPQRIVDFRTGVDIPADKTR